MLLLSTLRSWSPCCSGRILWSGWALVRRNTKRKREKEGKNLTHGTAGNSVRARQTQRATINSHVTAGATSVLLISLSRQGRNWGTAEQFILWPPHLFPLINLQLFPSPVCESGSMHDQAPRVCCSVDCKNGRDLGQRSLITGMHVCGSVRGRLHLLTHLDLPSPGCRSQRLQLSHKGHRQEMVLHNLWSW